MTSNSERIANFIQNFQAFNNPIDDLSKNSLALRPELRTPSIDMPPPRNPAELAIARLNEEITAFEEGLSPDEEVGAIIVGAPGNTVFHINRVYHLNMDMVVLEGLNEHNKPQRLVQHVSQLSVLLTALPKLGATPRRIGYVVSSLPDEAI
jgi:hypothetical protein